MTSAVVARRLGQLISLVVLLASGTYLLVYLYRWEWNRALVAGIFFVAAEVAIAAGAILRRLRGIESRLDALATGPDPQVLGRIRASAPEAPDRFAWLEERARSMNVFVPVLLGAGVVLSVLAAAVERLASVTAVPAAESRLARRLGALALPEGGLVGGGVAAPPRITRLDHRPPARPLQRLAVRAFAVLAVGFLLTGAVDVLADETQDRPDAEIGGSMAVSLVIDRRSEGRSPARTAEALFVACRHTVGDRSEATVVDQVAGVVTLVVTPAFGEHGQRRLVGCLEDATFDRVSANVVGVDHIRTGG